MKIQNRHIGLKMEKCTWNPIYIWIFSHKKLKCNISLRCCCCQGLSLALKSAIHFFVSINIHVDVSYIRMVWKIWDLLCPLGIKHFQIFFNDSNFFLLVSLIEILKNNGNIHVDNNHVINDDEWDKVDDCNEWVTTVSIRQVTVVGVTIGWGHQKGL